MLCVSHQTIQYMTYFIIFTKLMIFTTISRFIQIHNVKIVIAIM